MRNVATQLHANVSVTINVELFNQKSMIYKYGLIYVKDTLLENLVGLDELLKELQNFHFLNYCCSHNLCFRQNSIDPTKVSSAMKISLDYNARYTSELLHFIIILVMLACHCQIIIVITLTT